MSSAPLSRSRLPAFFLRNLSFYWRQPWLPRISVKAVDTTGAGDTLAAALAVAFVEGRSLDEAGPFASAAAALTTTKLGARPALPYRQQVEDLLSHIEGQQDH